MIGIYDRIGQPFLYVILHLVCSFQIKNRLYALTDAVLFCIEIVII